MANPDRPLDLVAAAAFLGCSTYTLADIIDIAINEHLWNGSRKFNYFKQSKFSCIALRIASVKTKVDPDKSVLPYLKSFGCNLDDLGAFGEFTRGPQRQYARALWLTWAAMIAREEGI